MRFPIILLLALISPLFSAENFPPEIAALKATYDKDVEVLRMQYEQALIKRSDVERVKLHDAEVKFTKAGNLDGALAARKLTEALPMFALPEAMKDASGDNYSSRVPGTYRYKTPNYAGVWTLKADKTAAAEGVKGTWEVDSKGKVTVTWESGRREYIHLPEQPRGQIVIEISNGTSGPAFRL
jgi:hypothetical protein